MCRALLVRCLLSFLSFLFFLSFLTVTCCSAARAEDAYAFRQVSRATGTCDVTVNATGIKVNTSSGCSIVAYAPRWDVYLINDKVKKYCQTPFASWHGNFGLSQDFLSGSQFSNVKFDEQTKPTRFLGLSARELNQTKDPKVPSTGRLSKEFRYDARARNLVYTLSDALVSDTHPAHLICQYDHIPYKGSFPLALKFMDETGKDVIGLATINLARMKVPESFFSVPKDYKKAANQQEIDLASKGDLLQEFLDGPARK